MRFAFVGTNAEAIVLLKEVASSTEHSLASSTVTEGLAAAAVSTGIPLRLAATAEEALLGPDTDIAVLALNDADETLRLARMASQADRHVIVFPPSPCVPAFSFELHLILDESRCAVAPLTHRCAFADLPADRHQLHVAEENALQLAMEISDAEASPRQVSGSRTGSEDPQQRLRQLVETGLDALSASGLKYAQVTALDSLAPDGKLLSRLITLNSLPFAEKSLPPATLIIRTNRLQEPVPTSMKITRSDGSTEIFTMDAVPLLLPRVLALCKSRELCGQWMESFSSTLELAEAVDKSIRRRRTVDVHFDTGSERGLFKSQMTAIGCGVLIFMLLGLVAYLILAQLTDLPVWALHAGRILWITPLVVFLLAQALLPFSRQRR